MKCGSKDDLSWIIFDTDRTDLIEGSTKGAIITNEIVAYALDMKVQSIIDDDREAGSRFQLPQNSDR